MFKIAGDYSLTLEFRMLLDLSSGLRKLEKLRSMHLLAKKNKNSNYYSILI